MAYLLEPSTPTFDPVYQLEAIDPLLGHHDGTPGELNWASQALVNRTAYLKQVSESIQVTNVAALRALAHGQASRIAITLSALSDNDNGGGIWRYADNSDPGTYVDNIGATVIPDGGDGSSAWIRMPESDIHAAWFGLIEGDTTEIATNNSRAIQAAIDYAQHTGRNLVLPPGQYKINATLNIPPSTPDYEYRADSFTICGAGAGNVFLGSELAKGTVIYADSDINLLRFHEYIIGASGNFYLRNIRFEQKLSTASAAVLRFDSLANYCRLSHLEIKQAGIGDGISFGKVYLIEIDHTYVNNRDHVAGSGTSRVGCGIRCESAVSGGLLTIRKVTARGWLNGFIIGSSTIPTAYLLASKLEQCECSTVTNGVTILAARGTVLDTCYFEAVYGIGVIDQGVSTTVKNSTIFVGSTGIQSTSANAHGSQYQNNTLLLDAANKIGIDVESSGDATGRAKCILGNYIYFTGSGGSLANVIGLKITGANPVINISANEFRPRREWVGGANTIKISNQSTGKITGVIPLTDTLYESPLLSNVGISLSEGGSLTQSNVVDGTLTLNSSSSYYISATTPTNVTAIDVGPYGRIIVLLFANTNLTLKKGTYLRLNSDFSGTGSIVLQLSGGVAYELARTTW